jgi:hypothetical protein
MVSAGSAGTGDASISCDMVVHQVTLSFMIWPAGLTDGHVAGAARGMFRMVAFRRNPQSNGRVSFDIPDLDRGSRDRIIEEVGLIAEAAGQVIGNSEPAQLYNVMFIRPDGTHGSRLGGFSVPAGIADAVGAGLVSHGHSVE